MARTLIANGYIVCVDPARQVFPDGFVAIDGTDIAAVGAGTQMPGRDSFDEVIDCAVHLQGLRIFRKEGYFGIGAAIV